MCPSWECIHRAEVTCATEFVAMTYVSCMDNDMQRWKHRRPAIVGRDGT